MRLVRDAVLGEPGELARLAPAPRALAYLGGDVFVASGDRVVCIGAAGAERASIPLDAEVMALATRSGRVYALAGAAVHVLAHDGAWRAVARVPLPLANAHDLDVDRAGKNVLVVANPRSGCVVDLETGKTIGRFAPARHLTKHVKELYARFSPESEHVFVAYSRTHRPQKLAYGGRMVAELEQASTWCTPLVASPDGRFLASRQSGIGVIVWDPRDEEGYVFFAELDKSTPHQQKFDKRMRQDVASAKQVAPGFVKITRWREMPEMEGEATAIGVAPRCAYAATADHEGRVTLVDTATRRISRSDGAVLQKACLTTTVRVAENLHRVRFDDAMLFVAKDGAVSALDLASGALASLGSLGGPADGHRSARADGDTLVVFEGRRARAVDRRTLVERWRFDDPLPRCKHVALSRGDLIGLEKLAGHRFLLHRFDPRSACAAAPLPIDVTPADFREQEDAHGFYDVTVKGDAQLFVDGCGNDGRSRAFRLLSDGAIGAAVPDGATILPDGVFETSLDGWRIVRADDHATVIAQAQVEDVTIGFAEVDLAQDRVVASDMHTHLVKGWTLRGAPTFQLDAVGSVAFSGLFFGTSADVLFVAERGGAVRRYIVA
jgi:hypothetical protein